MAIVFKRNQYRSFKDDEYNHIVQFRPRGGGVEYGLLAAWDQEQGGITSKEEFIANIDKSFIDSKFGSRMQQMIYPAKEALGIK